MSKNNLMQKIFVWLYRIFSFLVPSGIAIYTFLISSLLKDDISITQKIGMVGIFTLIIMAIIAVYFLGKHFKNSLNKITNEILECMDNEKKAQLIIKKRKIEGKQEMFRNACFLVPFIIFWLLCVTIEKGIVSLRGTLMFICLSMSTGFGFNGVVQYLNTKK